MLNSALLIKSGIKPGHTFGKCLHCNTLEEALEIWHNSDEFKKTQQPPTEKKDWSGTVWEWLCENPCFENMFSRENNSLASRSEKKRWLEQGAVIINGAAMKPDEQRPDKIESLVFFPHGDRKCTML